MVESIEFEDNRIDDIATVWKLYDKGIISEGLGHYCCTLMEIEDLDGLNIGPANEVLKRWALPRAISLIKKTYGDKDNDGYKSLVEYAEQRVIDIGGIY